VQPADVDERHVAEVADDLGSVVLRAPDRFPRAAGAGNVELADHHDADRPVLDGMTQAEEPRAHFGLRRDCGGVGEGRRHVDSSIAVSGSEVTYRRRALPEHDSGTSALLAKG
jgi:hypothetical protein